MTVNIIPHNPFLKLIFFLTMPFNIGFGRFVIMVRERVDVLKQRGHKEMSSILADQQRPRIWAQMRGDREGISANECSCAHGAQINFGYLTPYLTCVLKQTRCNTWRLRNFNHDFVRIHGHDDEVVLMIAGTVMTTANTVNGHISLFVLCDRVWWLICTM
jgi:hypothetical protein